MKKVLLSLSVLAASFAANAQSIEVGKGAYDDFADVLEYNYTTNNSGIYYWTDACFNGLFPGFADASTNPVVTDGLKRRENGELKVSIDKTQNTNNGGAGCPAVNEYSPFGVNFGDDNGAAAGGNAYYIDISANKTFSCRIKASANVSVRLQIEDANGKKLEGTAAVYGSEYTKSVTTAYTTWSQDLTGGVGFQHSGCAGGTNPCAVTGFDYTKVTKVMFFVQPGSSTFVGDIYIDDFKIGASANTGLSAKSIAANISSSVVFPNPASDAVYANLNLKSANDVTVIVTDLMGRQVATKAFGRVSEINNAEIFNAASLAKGMYTVTYVLDGAPAKSDLVVVK